MSRVYYKNTAIGRNTTTSATFGDQVSLTFTPNASKTYLILFRCLLDNSSTTADSLARLYHDTAAVAGPTFNYEAKDTTDKYQCIGGYLYTAPGSPTSQTFSIEFSSESGNTTGCQDAEIIALELAATDLFSSVAAFQSTTVAAFSDIGTSVVCPAGDYLLISAAEIRVLQASPPTTAQWEIHNGSAQLTVTGPSYVQDTTNYVPWWSFIRVTPVSTTTYKQRFRSDGTADVRSRNSTLVALDLSQFSDWIYGESLGDSTTTNTAAQTKLSVTDTPVNADYLQLFACSIKNSSTTVSGRVDYTRGGTPISVEAERESPTANEVLDHGFCEVANLAAVSTTWLTRYRAEAGTNTVTIRNAAFAALQLGNVPGAALAGMPMRAGGVLAA